MKKNSVDSKAWFAVDKDGFREATGHLPPERLVFEMIQNALDEDITLCDVTVEQKGRCTDVRVSDDCPEGFRDLSHAYTLYRTTRKRTDATKRGRFNIGEKIVLAQAVSGEVKTTKGTVVFSPTEGRQELDDCTTAGSVIKLRFPKWKQRAFDNAIVMLSGIYVPGDCKLVVNGETVPYRPPLKTREATLRTELLKDKDGQKVMVRTSRKTVIHFHPKAHEKAHLCEMGLPICKIDGKYDADVQQKVPQSQDRTLVSDSYLQDIYAEMLIAFQDDLDEEDLGSSAIRAALEDDRVEPDVAVKVFKKQFGDNAVITSPFDLDANQEAARAGAPQVSPRTFGSSVNDKFRMAGIQTTTEAYSRDKGRIAENGIAGYKESTVTPARKRLVAYVSFMSNMLYGKDCKCEFAQWDAYVLAMYNHGHTITWNTRQPALAQMVGKLVSKATSTVLHELAHAMGNGHDGVYDHEFERLVNLHTVHLIKHPEQYREFEPELFDATP